MRNLFTNQSKNPIPTNIPSSQPPPSNNSPEAESSIAASMPPTTTRMPSLCDLIPDDPNDKIDFTGMESPIALKDLFKSGNDHWVRLYDRIA